MQKLWVVFKKAPFPAIMALFALGLFVCLYRAVTVESVKLYIAAGLIFCVPFSAYAAFAFLAAKHRIKRYVSALISVAMVIPLGILMMFAQVILSFDAGTTVFTDPADYARVIRTAAFSEEMRAVYFPEKLPTDASAVRFHYNPAFMEADETLMLKFTADAKTISAYADRLEDLAVWQGSMSDSGCPLIQKGIPYSGYESLLPDDFTVYVFVYSCSGYENEEVSLAAVSLQRNEALFFAVR